MRAHRITVFLLLLGLSPLVEAGMAAEAGAETGAVAGAEMDMEAHVGQQWALCTPFTFPDPVLEPPPPGAIRTESDTLELVPGGVSLLQGSIALRDDQRHLLADSLRIDEPRQQLHASGDILYWDDTLVIEGDTAHADERAETTAFSNTRYRIPERHARGEADHMVRLPDGRTRLQGMSYTTCDDGDDHWRLNASRVTLNHDSGRGTASHVRLRFMKVPFAYIPWMSFPITDERMTGLLAPTIKWDPESGSYDITAPVYLNLAPSFDATVVPRTMDDRGFLLGTELRYLTRDSQGTWYGEQVDDAVYGERRYSYTVDHHTRFSRRWTGELSLEGVSDEDYRSDLGDQFGSSAERYHRQLGELDYRGPWLDARTRLETYQPVHDDTVTPYQRLPQIVWTTPGRTGQNRFNWGLGGEVVNFAHEQRDLTGVRQDYTVSAGYPMESLATFLRPEVRLRHTEYHLEDAGDDSTPHFERTVPTYILDSGIFLERQLNGPVPLIQTLEPRLFYVETPFSDQQGFPNFDTSERSFSYASLFTPDRFTGPDRVGDQQRLTTGVTTRFIGRDTGLEYLTVSGGQIQHFRDREVRLGDNQPPEESRRSDLIGELTGRVGPWRSAVSLLYNPEHETLPQRTVRLEYQAGPRRLFNMQYRDSSHPETGEYSLRQATASSIWALTDRWHGIGHLLQDLEEDFTREGLIGLGYDNCCWAARLVARTYRQDRESDQDQNLFLELTLKGMTTLGGRLDAMLQDAILGYQPQAQ